ncbi:MAG: T9SS type A sorting domain-containing protein [Vicingaceae bacterium]|nr:T9SS type A sorting domain-containing protein [Vicingaceae bacterium]
MRLFVGFILLIITSFSFGQQTINGSITHGGIQRTYILYVPVSYSVTTAAPLVFNFHGLTSNATAQLFYGEFRPIADTAGFLIVAPQGTVNQQGDTYWNAGFGGTVDDVGFTEALLDSISAAYNINQDRVYSTGMSNGGYMSYYLACNLSDRITAIASVTGAMTKGLPNTCNPDHPTPVMEIHGDADATVPYNGNFVSESVQTGLNYWVNYNNTNSTPIVTALPNLSTTDNSAVEHYVYSGGDSCVDVEHYKILSGGHTWPGAPVNTGSGNTNHDIEASLLIWEFFAKYDINGKINCVSTGINGLDKNEFKLNIYPNPASDFLTIEWEGIKNVSSIRIKNILGKEILTINVKGQNQIKINTQELSKGIYFSELLEDFEVLESRKVILQ